MKKLSLIVCILSLFSFTNAFAEDSTDTPAGADHCADERSVSDKAQAAKEEAKSEAATVKSE